ncbi:MAG: DUF2240 family protein [Methanomicrobiales archaeon]|nr:DUF2240 family protein [Methanomicrobiales archaeon]
MSLKVAVAAPFKHTRKESLSRAEFIFYLTIDKKWMNREQAELFIARAGSEGLLESTGGVLKPRFDLAEVAVPIGFRPGAEILRQEDPVQELITRIASAIKAPPMQVAAEMNQLIKERFDDHLFPEAAIVILAKKYDIPYTDLIPRLEKAVCGNRK